MSVHLEEIEALVRQIVSRTLGQEYTPTQRAVLHAEDVQQMPANSTQPLPAGTLITPLARQAALERRIRLETTSEERPTQVSSSDSGKRTIAIGADHGGYALKETIKNVLKTADFEYTVLDCGTHNLDSVDYPDFAYAVARLVADGRAWRGIVIDGAGIGSCMAANKVPGVRAAMCYDQATAVNSREHNDANVLTLGAGLIGPNLARQIVITWLNTEFGGHRHARRVNKIEQIERRFTQEKVKIED